MEIYYDLDCLCTSVPRELINSIIDIPITDVRSIPFHAGEMAGVSTESPSQRQGISVLESLAIGICVLMLIFIYAAGIIFYVHYKQKQKRKQKDAENNMSSNSENGSSLESRIDLSNVVTNFKFIIV